MNRLALFILPVVLSACSATVPEKKETLPEPKPVTYTPKKSAQITTAGYMTDQENELKLILEKTPFPLLRHNNILVISFSGESIFAPNSYHPTETATQTLKKIALILSVYDKTRISIIGHTDSMGKPATNQLLSEKRADAVANILKKSAKIATVRLWVEGQGDRKSEGSNQNNRVDIILTPTFVK